MVLPSSSASIDTTASSFARFIALTPLAVLPISLTCSSLNLIACPSLVPMNISFEPSVSLVAMSSSPSSRPSAIMPPERILENDCRSVFFITPYFVAMTINLPSANSFTGRNAVIFSSCVRFKIFTIAFPFAAAPA